ncbi:MAG TPA: DUF5131 family protein [Spirochaetota bacterium]|nr:DUF5131 family protein [Spirochaetota bacterium]HPI90437.1 DUF5131 family protein [Spirochaetota bacterium]HPR49345.1 DUF5131 family protein [Spirochaetota bacterium]
MTVWNPWHGCHKLSAGCKNCYVYRIDSKFERDSSIVAKTGSYNLPVRRGRRGNYKLAPGETVYTCFSSDFFLEDADEWRKGSWGMIKERADLHFFIITKRIDRLHVNLPEDWGSGYPNVSISCTVENQDRADYRLPLLVDAPLAHRSIICEPLLERIDLRAYLSPVIEEVVVGGESGTNARVCDYDWVLAIRDQCISAHVPFHFRQTGAKFRKDGRIYYIPRRLQASQAYKAGIDFPDE